MNDNLKRYSAIILALRQVLGYQPGTHRDRNLMTLAALISGLVASGKAHLPAIAAKSKLGGKPQSRQKRYTRWLQNKAVNCASCFFPFAKAMLQSLPAGPLTLIMDGSEVGRGCLALMVAVAYEGRALPLAWTVVRGKKGHFPQNAHVQLAQQVRNLIPEGREVVFLGDGEFDGVELLECIEKFGWKYVCRTAKSTLVYSETDVSSGYTGIPIRDYGEDFGLKPGQGFSYRTLFFTGKKYGPVQVAAVWESGHEEPIYLVTNLPELEQAHTWYKKRFRIETFFSDQKSRGFHIRHSHLSDPARLSRLLIASCLAYYWVVCLGRQVRQKNDHRLIHRTDRCDLSLFRLGMQWLEHCINEGWRIDVFFEHQE